MPNRFAGLIRALAAAFAVNFGLWASVAGALAAVSAPSSNEGRPVEKYQHFKQIKLVWSAQGEIRPLPFPDPAVSVADPGGVRSKRPTAVPNALEADPKTGELAHWKGVLTSDLVDRVIFELSPDQRALADLVILKDRSGQQLLIPRAILNRYPILLASHKNEKDLGGLIPVVFPFRSKPKLSEESVPFAQLGISDLVEIEISNYRKHFDRLLLSRQTDPAAVRGEKLFLQNCLSCHAVGRAPGLAELVDQGRIKSIEYKDHPKLDGAPKLTSRDRRALMNYYLTYQLERTGAAPKSP